MSNRIEATVHAVDCLPCSQLLVALLQSCVARPWRRVREVVQEVRAHELHAILVVGRCVQPLHSAAAAILLLHHLSEARPVLVHVFFEEGVWGRRIGQGPEPRVEYGVVATEQGGEIPGRDVEGQDALEEL